MPTGGIAKPVLPRLEANHFKEPNSGCWLWTAHLRGFGYGGISVNGKLCWAHRVSYETYVGPIPAGMHICHKCDTRSCINPDHLFVGTRSDNMQDCVRKGRMYMQIHPEKSALHDPKNRGNRWAKE